MRHNSLSSTWFSLYNDAERKEVTALQSIKQILSNTEVVFKESNVSYLIECDLWWMHKERKELKVLGKGNKNRHTHL